MQLRDKGAWMKSTSSCLQLENFFSLNGRAISDGKTTTTTTTTTMRAESRSRDLVDREMAPTILRLTITTICHDESAGATMAKAIRDGATINTECYR